MKLPPAEAPSLEALRVRVPAPRAVQAAEIQERLHQLLRERAPSRERAAGEAVAMGDEILIDVLGYARGRLIPFSLRSELWMELRPDPLLPGFAEGLAGMKVGLSARLDLALPASYPVAALRGAPAAFLVDVRAAREVAMPAESDRAALAALGRGNDLPSVLRSLAEEIQEEHRQQQQLEAQERVLDEVAARTRVELPRALVDEEIQRSWGKSEGPLVARKGFSAEEQQEALQGWLEDEATRFDAARRLRISLGLAALLGKEQLRPGLDDLRPILSDIADEAGIPLEEALAGLKGRRSEATALVDRALHLFAVRYVMGRVALELEG